MQNFTLQYPLLQRVLLKFKVRTIERRWGYFKPVWFIHSQFTSARNRDNTCMYLWSYRVENTQFHLTEHTALFPGNLQDVVKKCTVFSAVRKWGPADELILNCQPQPKSRIQSHLWWRQEWGYRLGDCSQIVSTINYKLKRRGDQGGHRLWKKLSENELCCRFSLQLTELMMVLYKAELLQGFTHQTLWEIILIVLLF